MFKPGHTPTHKGTHTTTDPIKDLEVVASIKASLSGRDLALWSLAINTALRAGDLCNLTWDDLDGNVLTVREGKTKKLRLIPLNAETLGYLIEWRKVCENSYIFSGQRGRMTTATWGRLVKSWCSQAGLKGSYSSHTCRKTWARLQHEKFGTSMATLMSALNHTTERQTLTYIGKLADDVTKAYSHSL